MCFYKQKFPKIHSELILYLTVPTDLFHRNPPYGMNFTFQCIISDKQIIA
jgi:hypothetical protein